MIERRDLLRGTAALAVLASAQTVSACSFAEFDDDTWGQRLIEFLRRGDESALDDLFKEHSSLVAFHNNLIEGTNELAFAGADDVKRAVIGFRNQMIAEGIAGTSPVLEGAVLVGSEQQGRMNKIELFFAEAKRVESSCGPIRTERAVDLFYEAGVHETGYDWVKWSILRIALIPRLELERFPG